MLDFFMTIPGMMIAGGLFVVCGVFIEGWIKNAYYERPRLEAAPKIEKTEPTPTPAQRKALSLFEIEALAHASSHPVMRQHRAH